MCLELVPKTSSEFRPFDLLTSMKNPLMRIGRPLRNRNHDRGFTLIELLVVIVMIGALAALLFSLIGKMRDKAYHVNALTSMRQVGIGCVAFSAENNGDINVLKWSSPSKDPAEGDIADNNTKFHVNNSFWGRLQPYLFTGAPVTTTLGEQAELGKQIKQALDGMFNTPDAYVMSKTFLSKATIARDGSGLPVPLSFNNNLNAWGSFLKVSAFSDPSQVFYATYGWGSFGEADGQAYVAIPPSPARRPIYYLSDRKALMMFLDGHVEPVSPPMPSRRFK
jgi:prepilin-type N-terminal cleavage/methylation domain-containing protein